MREAFKSHLPQLDLKLHLVSKGWNRAHKRHIACCVSYQLPATSYQLPATSYQALFASHVYKRRTWLAVALCASQPSHSPGWSLRDTDPERTSVTVAAPAALLQNSMVSCLEDQTPQIQIQTPRYAVSPRRAPSPNTLTWSRIGRLFRGDEVVSELRCCQARYRNRHKWVRKCKMSDCGQVVAVKTDEYKGKGKEWRGLASMHFTETILGVQE